VRVLRAQRESKGGERVSHRAQLKNGDEQRAKAASHQITLHDLAQASQLLQELPRFERQGRGPRRLIRDTLEKAASGALRRARRKKQSNERGNDHRPTSPAARTPRIVIDLPLLVDELLEDILFDGMERIADAAHGKPPKLATLAVMMVQKYGFFKAYLDKDGLRDEFGESAAYAFTHRAERRQVWRRQLRLVERTTGWDTYRASMTRDLIAIVEEYVERCRHNLPRERFFEKILEMYRGRILYFMAAALDPPEEDELLWHEMEWQGSIAFFPENYVNRFDGPDYPPSFDFDFDDAEIIVQGPGDYHDYFEEDWSLIASNNAAYEEQRKKARERFYICLEQVLSMHGQGR